MQTRSFLLTASLFSCAFTYAQQVHHFKSGLIANTGTRYGREAIYTDALAWQLYGGSLVPPKEGAVFATTEKGEKIVWTTVQADSLNRLRSMRGFQRGSGPPAGPGVNQGALRGGIGPAGAYVYLSYASPKEQTALLNVKGNSAVYVNGALHMGDVYNLGYLYIPVLLKKGLNEFYVRGASVSASLIFPEKKVEMNTEDPTMPFVVLGKENKTLKGAVVVLNATGKEGKGWQIKAVVAGKERITTLPVVPAMSSRKVAFDFDGSGINEKGKFNGVLTLMEKGKAVDEKTIPVEAVSSSEQYSNTFVSNIDGSLQYYAVTPQNGNNGNALFLSVHGAGVEAIGQARAYKPKDWGNLVAATNRRPRGFNWEDWGRLDALEVLNIATQKFNPNPQQIYLTGHSMGGHGTWFLGATYPDKWAAIAPCAGYPTMKGYGSADGLIPDSSNNPLEQMLLRSSNQSDVPKLAMNYKPLGVYVFHGDADRTVPVTYARQMRKLLGEFHPDLSYYEYPGGEHWFGDQSVDWKPMFDFFQWHKRPLDSAANSIDFSTASPGISASCYWATVYQQEQHLQYSRIQLKRNRGAGTISGSTQNVRLLAVGLKDFTPGQEIKISLDENSAVSYVVKPGDDSVYLLKQAGTWSLSSRPALSEKGPHRYGTLKDAFQYNMVFVYSTTGTKAENEWSRNKAIYDAETWYYRGNGAVDIVSDKEFSMEKYKDRGVILFGNKSTNAAWNMLLADCPIQMERNKISGGTKSWLGDDLAAYFVWPLRNSTFASVAVIGGTGLKGMNAANGNQYFAGASGFPDFMVYAADMLKNGPAHIKLAGFYDHKWALSEEYQWKD